MLRRPVKFIADRLESFLSDIHAREHRVKVRLAATKAGDILAFDLVDLTAIGPYSVYPRTSGIEGNQVVNLTGGPYRHKEYRARLNVVFTNRNVTCQYRAVGHPIAVAITEAAVDLAASKLGIDPVAFRRRNLIPDDAYPYTAPSGIRFEQLSHHQCLDRLVAMMDYDGLRRQQVHDRERRDRLARSGRTQHHDHLAAVDLRHLEVHHGLAAILAHRGRDLVGVLHHRPRDPGDHGGGALLAHPRSRTMEMSFFTAGVGCAPWPIQWSARARSTSTMDGSVCGLYRPIVSMLRPSRGERESLTTTR